MARRVQQPKGAKNSRVVRRTIAVPGEADDDDPDATTDQNVDSNSQPGDGAGAATATMPGTGKKRPKKSVTIKSPRAAAAAEEEESKEEANKEEVFENMIPSDPHAQIAHPMAIFQALRMAPDLSVLRRTLQSPYGAGTIRARVEKKVAITDRRGRTPLHHAAMLGYSAAIHLLLPCGAVVDAVDADGNTPLMLAAENGQCAALQLLLDRCEPVLYIYPPRTQTLSRSLCTPRLASFRMLISSCPTIL
jgi:hypothetical protein